MTYIELLLHHFVLVLGVVLSLHHLPAWEIIISPTLMQCLYVAGAHGYRTAHITGKSLHLCSRETAARRLLHHRSSTAAVLFYHWEKFLTHKLSQERRKPSMQKLYKAYGVVHYYLSLKCFSGHVISNMGGLGIALWTSEENCQISNILNSKPQ